MEATTAATPLLPKKESAGAGVRGGDTSDGQDRSRKSPRLWVATAASATLATLVVVLVRRGVSFTTTTKPGWAEDDPWRNPFQTLSVCGAPWSNKVIPGSYRLGPAEPCDALRGGDEYAHADDETANVLHPQLKRSSIFFIGDSTSKLVTLDACTSLLPSNERCFNNFSSPNVYQAPRNLVPLRPDDMKNPSAVTSGSDSDSDSCCGVDGSCCMTMQEMQSASGCFVANGGGLGHMHAGASFTGMKAFPCPYSGYFSANPAVEAMAIPILQKFRALASALPLVVVVDLNYWVPTLEAPHGLPVDDWLAISRRLVSALTARAGVAKSCVVLKTQWNPVGVKKVLENNAAIRVVAQRLGVHLFDWFKISHAAYNFGPADACNDNHQCPHVSLAIMKSLSAYIKTNMATCTNQL